MPYEIRLDHPPAGFAGTSARADELLQVIFREFTSTEDGQHFISRLERGVDPILKEIPTSVQPSAVDHMLAISRKDGKTTVFLNELEIEGTFRSARPVKKGQGITKDDIADIVRIDLGVDIPVDAGFIFVFSVDGAKDFSSTMDPLDQTKTRDLIISVRL